MLVATLPGKVRELKCIGLDGVLGKQSIKALSIKV